MDFERVNNTHSLILRNVQELNMTRLPQALRLGHHATKCVPEMKRLALVYLSSLVTLKPLITVFDPGPSIITLKMTSKKMKGSDGELNVINTPCSLPALGKYRAILLCFGTR